MDDTESPVLSIGQSRVGRISDEGADVERIGKDALLLGMSAVYDTTETTSPDIYLRGRTRCSRDIAQTGGDFLPQ